MPRKGYEIQRNFYYYWILLEHFVNVLTILHEFPWAYIDGERIVNFYSILLARIYIFYNTLEILSRATSFYSWLILINAMRRKEYENTDDGERNFYSIFYINLYFAKRFENFYFKLRLFFFFFSYFRLTKGIGTNFDESQFRRRPLSPRNRKLLGPPSLPCFSLSDLPSRAFTTHWETPFPHRFLLIFQLAPLSHSLFPPPIYCGWYRTTCEILSIFPINVTYKCKQHRQHPTSISCYVIDI